MAAHDGLWGWDPTPGIVSVWAEPDGRATIWRRIAGSLVREEATFRPWVLVSSMEQAQRLGTNLQIRELSGPGALRFVVRGHRPGPLRDLGEVRGR